MKLTVTFTSQGRMLEASLFLPPQSTDKLAPALLFETSMTGATMQVSEYIARELSQSGFICMILDHSFYSEDESAAQAWESPSKRVEDIKSGLRFLSQQSTVDQDRIVGVGVSVGAEYLARAIKETGYCKAFILVQGPLDDSQNYIGTLDVPTLVVDESHVDATVDEISLWVRTLFGRSLAPRQERSDWMDWYLADK